MNEKNSLTNTEETTRNEKRAWQPPVMEELDVATVTTLGIGLYMPVDFATYSS